MLAVFLKEGGQVLVFGEGMNVLLARVAGGALVPGDQNLLLRSLRTEPLDLAPVSRLGEGRRCWSFLRADGSGLPLQDPVSPFCVPCVSTI